MRYLQTVVAAAVGLAVLGFSGSVQAELPPLSAEDLESMATDIIQGKVVQVYSVEAKREQGFVDRLYAIEVAVTTVKKGEGITAGEVIYARTWKSAKRPSGWAGPGGQYEIPKVGAQVTVYLKGDKGAFDALTPNGIQ